MEPGNNDKQDQTDKSIKILRYQRKRKRIEPLENKFDSYIRRDDDIKNELKNLKRNQQLILKKLDILTNSINNKTSSLSYPCQLKPTLPGSSVDECIHGEVLQENLKMLVREMDLSNGLIFDEMLQNGSLTDNEAHEIKELSRPDKTRKLVTLLGRSNKTKFRNFLRIIEDNEFYPHIANILSQSYEKKLREQENHPKCTRCYIIKTVKVKHILDHLCENHVIGLEEISYLIKENSADVDKFWRDIFKKMEHPVFGESCVSVFTNSLTEHYPHIAKTIKGYHQLKCFCASTILSYPSGSGGNASELSATSSIIPESSEQLISNKSNRSEGDSSDISTSTVIAEPKPETQEWVQRHQRLTALGETGDLKNYTSTIDQMIKNESNTKFSEKYWILENADASKSSVHCKYPKNRHFRNNRIKHIIKNQENTSLINSSPISQRELLQKVHEDLIKGRKQHGISKRSHKVSIRLNGKSYVVSWCRKPVDIELD